MIAKIWWAPIYVVDGRMGAHGRMGAKTVFDNLRPNSLLRYVNQGSTVDWEYLQIFPKKYLNVTIFDINSRKYPLCQKLQILIVDNIPFCQNTTNIPNITRY